jgi:hypothetical protein
MLLKGIAIDENQICYWLITLQLSFKTTEQEILCGVEWC